MKVLVTGSKGFIGQNLLEKLPSDWFVTSFDIKDNPETRPRDLDLSGVNWVVHIGALSSTTEKDVRRVMDLNLSWSIELLEEAEKARANFQWSSSASVYGRSNQPMKEADRANPRNLYAMSKYLFEEYVKNSQSNIIRQGFRYFNVYGPHEDHKGSQASPYHQFARQARETGVIQVFEGSESCLRDFIHADRVVDAHLKMMSVHDSGIFNVGTGNPRSFLDVARDVALFYNARIEVVPFPDHLKEHYQYYTCADTSMLDSIILNR
jgi:ADP-L-glycero-D-manno-heptose 6-epimerase